MRKLILLGAGLTALFGCGVQGFLDEAEIKRVSGKTEDALELYTRAIKQDKNSLIAYENRAKIYSALKIYDNAISDYREAARIAESQLTSKEKAADFYYLAAVTQSIDNLKSGLSKCFLVAHDMQKACELGLEEACASPCAPKEAKPLSKAPSVSSLDFGVEAINYPKVNNQSEMILVLKPRLIGADNKTVEWNDYRITVDVFFGDGPKVASVTEDMNNKVIVSLRTGILTTADNNKPIYVSGIVELPNGTNKTMLGYPKTALNKNVSIPF